MLSFSSIRSNIHSPGLLINLYIFIKQKYQYKHIKNKFHNHSVPVERPFGPGILLIFKELYAVFPVFGTNLSIKVLANPPTNGIFPTKPYTAPLFLVNKPLKNDPTLDQNPGFLPPFRLPSFYVTLF